MEDLKSGCDWYVDWFEMADNPNLEYEVVACPSDLITGAYGSNDPVAEEPVTENPATEEPVTENPTTEEPATDNPTTKEAVTENPTTEEPVTETPATDNEEQDGSSTHITLGSLFGWVELLSLFTLIYIRKRAFLK